MRIGLGYDAHQFKEGRRLVLGGVVIPYKYGLSGHSDADVLIHSIIDSLLGSLKLGDIGKWFPDTEPEYKDAESLCLLKTTYQKIVELGYVLVNCDSVIIAQEPKLMNYIPLMCENISSALNIDKEMVSIKSTTTEGMGFEGRKEGIAAQTVCLLEKR